MKDISAGENSRYPDLEREDAMREAEMKEIGACVMTGLVPTDTPKPYKKAPKSKALKKRRAKAKAARAARRRNR